MSILILVVITINNLAMFYFGRWWQKKYHSGKVDIVCKRIIGRFNQQVPIIRIKGNVHVEFTGDIWQDENTVINSVSGQAEEIQRTDKLIFNLREGI